MTLSRWEPFSGLTSIPRDFDRWVESRFGPLTRFNREMDFQTFPVDIYDKNNEVVVKASLPGIKAEDLELNILGDALSIKAQTQDEEEIKDEDYVRRERYFGYYQRLINLPPNLKLDDADAAFEDGVLTLRIPKREEARPRQISVRPGGQAGSRTLEAKESQHGQKTEPAA